MEEYAELIPVDPTEHFHLYFFCLFYCDAEGGSMMHNEQIFSKEFISDYDVDLLDTKKFHVKFLPTDISPRPYFKKRHQIDYLHEDSKFFRFR